MAALLDQVEELQQSLSMAVERLATAQQAAAAARRSSDERIHVLEARLQQCNIDVRELKCATSTRERGEIENERERERERGGGERWRHTHTHTERERERYVCVHLVQPPRHADMLNLAMM
jgi:hypothetical protein